MTKEETKKQLWKVSEGSLGLLQGLEYIEADGDLSDEVKACLTKIRHDVAAIDTVLLSIAKEYQACLPIIL